MGAEEEGRRPRFYVHLHIGRFYAGARCPRRCEVGGCYDGGHDEGDGREEAEDILDARERVVHDRRDGPVELTTGELTWGRLNLVAGDAVDYLIFYGWGLCSNGSLLVLFAVLFAEGC